MKIGCLMKCLLLMVVCVFVLQGIGRADDVINAASITVNGETKEYLTFAQARTALKKVTTPATLTLLKDCKTGDKRLVLEDKAPVTLNLNGYSLTYDDYGSLPVIENECKLTVIGPGTIKGPHGIGVRNDLVIIGAVTFVCVESDIAYHSSTAGNMDLSMAKIDEWKILNNASKNTVINASQRLILPEKYKVYYDDQEVTELVFGKAAIIKKAAAVQKAIAQVNNTNYSAISEALAAWAESGGNLTLLDNAVCDDLNITLQAGKEYTFQGGDYTLDLGNQPLSVNGTLNIVSGAISGVLACNGGSINVESDAGAGLAVKNVDPQGSAADIKLPDGYCLMTAPENGQYVEQLQYDQTAWIVKHTHAVETYSADEAVSAIMANCVCRHELGRLMLVAPVDSVYSGLSQDVAVVAKGSLADEDYALTYNTADGKAPVHAGKYAVTLTAAGVSVSEEYTIAPAKITLANATLANVTFRANGAYDFNAGVTFSGIVNNEVLIPGVDYAVTVMLTGSNQAGEIPAEVTVVLKSGDYVLDSSNTFNTSVKIDALSLANASIADIPDQRYTGIAIQPDISVVVDGISLAKGVDFDVSYDSNVNVGESVVTVTGIGNYTGVIKKSFQIVPASALIEASTDKETYTYGELIRVMGRVVAKDVQTLHNAPETVTLYNGASLLASTKLENGAFVLEYDTKGKTIHPGEGIVLTVHYGGGNLEEKSAVLEAITLNKVMLTVASMNAIDRAYEPENQQVAIENIALTGVMAEDEVTVKTEGLTGVIESADAGVYHTIVLPDALPLVGAHAAFYTAAGGEVAAEVEISKRMLTSVQAPGDAVMDEYCATAETVIARLPIKIICTDENGCTHELPIKWDCAEFNKAPEATSAFVWAVDLGRNFDGDEEIVTGTICVTNGKAYAVDNIGKDTEMIYSGSTYDVSGLFAIDDKAGEASYAIVGGDGAGSLQGTMLTITKAGTLTIRLTTAAHTVDGLPYAAGCAEAVLTIRKGESAGCTLPTGLTAVYGDNVQAVTLPEGWMWKEPANKVGNAGLQQHQAAYNPNSALWNDKIVDLSIQVEKAEPHMDGTPNLGKVEPGTMVEDVPSTPIAALFDVPGTVLWQVPADTPVEAGKAYAWTFVPEDSQNYKEVSGTVVLLDDEQVTATPTPVVTATPTPTPNVTATTTSAPPTPPMPQPEIQFPLTDQLMTVTEGDQATMTVMALDATHYQWYVDEGRGYRPINGATGPGLSISAEMTSDGNRYFCRISNVSGVVDSPVFTLVVLPDVDVPFTGDSAHPALWMTLLLLSAALLLHHRHKYEKCF